MIAWLSANIGTILIGLVVLAVVIAIVCSIRKDKRSGKSSCGGNCGACGGCGGSCNVPHCSPAPARGETASAGRERDGGTHYEQRPGPDSGKHPLSAGN